VSDVWEPVTVKAKPAMLVGQIDAKQEEDALTAFKDTLQEQPEPHHISLYVDSFRHTFDDGEEVVYLITR